LTENNPFLLLNINQIDVIQGFVFRKMAFSDNYCRPIVIPEYPYNNSIINSIPFAFVCLMACHNRNQVAAPLS